MIEGITVLNQTEIMDLPSWFNDVNIVLITVFAIAFIIFMASRNNLVMYVSGFTAFMTIISIMVNVLVVDEVPTGRYKYEVTIDESVDFVDIYDKYEVMDQRGDIWILKEKEK